MMEMETGNILIVLTALLVGMTLSRWKDVFSALREEPGGKISSGRLMCFAIIFNYLYRGGDIPKFAAGVAVLFYFATRVDKRLIQAVLMKFLGISDDKQNT